MIAPFICFDIAFTSTNNLERMAKSNLIVTMSDDSWYGKSFAKSQHLQLAQIRSLESGRPQLFTSNNGATAIIDEKGAITKEMPFNQKGYVHGRVQGYTGMTPYLLWGNTPILLLCFFILGFSVFYKRRSYAKP